MTWPNLFELSDLPSWLQVPSVDTETATRIRQYVNGWLMSATRLTAWPNPVPDDLFAWAIELAGIAFRNPDGAASESIDDYARTNYTARRKEILDAARAAYSGAATPSYFFPDWDWHWTTTVSTSSSLTQ